MTVFLACRNDSFPCLPQGSRACRETRPLSSRAQPRDLSRTPCGLCAVSQQYGLHMTNTRTRSDPFGSPPSLLGGSLRVTPRDFSFNNFLRVRKPRFFVGAVGCVLTLPQGAMLACALRSSSSQKSRAKPCDFREPCCRKLSALRKRGECARFHLSLAQGKSHFSAAQPYLAMLCLLQER